VRAPRLESLGVEEVDRVDVVVGATHDLVAAFQFRRIVVAEERDGDHLQAVWRDALVGSFAHESEIDDAPDVVAAERLPAGRRQTAHVVRPHDTPEAGRAAAGEWQPAEIAHVHTSLPGELTFAHSAHSDPR